MTDISPMSDRNLPDAREVDALPVLDSGWAWQQICGSESLLEAGDGVRFEVPGIAGLQAAFAVRSEGQVRAYLNQCRHVPVELDWQPGKFFDLNGLYLVCATHGAAYDPVDGECIAGPCQGKRLLALRSQEIDGKVWVAIRTEY